jgi:hypothetical protein
MPAWMPGARLIKLRFRPQKIATAFVKVGNEVRQYLLSDEHYYFTIDDRLTIGRNVR